MLGFIGDVRAEMDDGDGWDDATTHSWFPEPEALESSSVRYSTSSMVDCVEEAPTVLSCSVLVSVARLDGGTEPPGQSLALLDGGDVHRSGTLQGTETEATFALPGDARPERLALVDADEKVLDSAELIEVVEDDGWLLDEGF